MVEKTKLMPKLKLAWWISVVIVFAVSLVNSDLPINDFVRKLIVAFAVLLWVLFLVYQRKEKIEKRAVYSLWGTALFVMIFSFYPAFTDVLLRMWDFRFFAVGIAVLSLGMALYINDKGVNIMATSYSGPIPPPDWLFFDDQSNKEIFTIEKGGVLAPRPGEVLPSIGDCSRWLVTSISEIGVKDWSKTPPVLYIAIRGHCLK